MKVSAPMVMIGPFRRWRGQADDHAGQDAGHGVGDDVITAGLPARRADRHRAFADHRRDGADGFPGGYDDDGQDQQGQGQAGGQDALAEAEGVNEDAERQQAIDDGRYGGQVGDVDLDDSVIQLRLAYSSR